MQDNSDLKYLMQAKRAIETYMFRGRSALKNVRSGRIEKADRLFRMQKAAWFNFEVAYMLIKDQSRRQSLDMYIAENLDDLLILQESQKELLKQQKSELSKKIVSLRKTKNHLNKYKRSQTNSSNIEQFI